MNILLVDDQPNILSSMVAGILWREMGFTSVYTAISAPQAREILLGHPVDIMVSDIEMPGEDGISLLTWARNRNMDFECIFLTSHADFFYAKQAISLHISDYVIQPAKNEDIVRAVQNAQKNIEERNKNKAELRFNSFSFAAQNIAVKSFFEAWPSADDFTLTPEGLEEKIRLLQNYNVACQEDTRCVVLFLHTREWYTLPLSPADFLSKYQPLADELFSSLQATGISYYAQHDCFYTIVFTPCSDKIEGSVENLYRQVTERIGCTLRLFYMDCAIKQMRTALHTLPEAEQRFGAEHSAETACLQYLQIAHSSNLMDASGNYDLYSRQIREYIRSNLSAPVTRSDIARALFLSPDHVSHIIKCTEKTTCKKLITSIKMEHAKKLLLYSRHPIGSIAQQCGYDNFAYFSKVYRETYGVTPREERKEK